MEGNDTTAARTVTNAVIDGSSCAANNRLWQSARGHTTPFSFSFRDIPNGRYTLAVHLCELEFGSSEKRAMTVQTNGLVRATDIDVYHAAGNGRYRARVARMNDCLATSSSLRCRYLECNASRRDAPPLVALKLSCFSNAPLSAQCTVCHVCAHKRLQSLTT